MHDHALRSYAPQSGPMEGSLDSLSVTQTGGQQAREDGITANIWAGCIPTRPHSCAKFWHYHAVANQAKHWWITG
eukprot:scaffold574765_cov20-Prasinocladus_malaysianus.AAC.1